MKAAFNKAILIFFIVVYLIIPIQIAYEDFYLLSSSAMNNINILIFIICGAFIYKLKGKDYLLRTTIIGVICVMPLITKKNLFLGYVYIKTYYTYIMAVVIIIFLILSLYKRKLKLNIQDKLALIYIVLVFVSAILSKYTHTSLWGNMLRFEGAFTILTYIVMYFSAKLYKDFEKDISVIIISSIAVSIVGICQFYGIFSYIVLHLLGAVYEKAVPCASTIGNQNIVGAYLILIMPFSLVLYIIKKRIIYLITAGINFLCLLCTNTKSAWLTFIIIVIFLFIYFLKQKEYLKRTGLIMLSFIIIIMFFSVTSSNSLIKRITSSYTHDFVNKDENNSKLNIDNIGSDRGFIWIRSISLIKNHPLFGSGPDTLGTEFMKKYKSETFDHYKRNAAVDKAHNEYIDIAVTTGLLSLIAYICFLGIIIKKASYVIKDKEYIYKKPINLILFLSCTGYVIQAFLNIRTVQVATIFWLFLGILSNYIISYKKINN